MDEFYGRLMRDAIAGPDVCGILYCMYWIRGGQIVPLYLGKAEKYGNNGYVSANLTTPRFFGRWGYARYYHLGDLGAALRGARRYRDWVERLFASPSTLLLRSETYFGAVIWRHADRCPCGNPTNVAALERCLIQHARRFHPDENLNRRDGGRTCRCPPPS